MDRLQNVPNDVGVIVVDHGSRLPAANVLLDEVVALYAHLTGVSIAEPAHMELAAPSLAEAFARCVHRGARRIVIQPYFLSPGRHSTDDIPRLAAEAAEPYPDVPFCVAEPLGLDERMCAVIHRRVLEAWEKTQS